MTTLEHAFARRAHLNAVIHDLEENEPIGLEYDKRDKYSWSMAANHLWDQKNELDATIRTLLDQQLDEYFNSALTRSNLRNWDKKEACRLLKERLNPTFTVSIKELFLYVGRSVMCIPDQYKDNVINGFARALDEWANVDIDLIREAMNNIGTKMEERCYHCNELMPEFEGGGHAICSDCA